MKIGFLLVTAFFCLLAGGQPVDSIFAKYRVNKTLPSGYIAEFSIALSYFPELRNTRIVVRKKNIRTTLSARPAFGSCFKKKENRTYYITIDTLHNKKHGLFEDLHTIARVGVIGHELSHISEYSKRGFFGMIGYGIAYGICRRRIEHRTDRITIEHRMGWQLHDYAVIAFNPDVTGKKFVRYKKRYYYTPEELLELIKKSDK